MADAVSVLNDARKKYQMSHLFVLFSGGHDSLTVTHWAIQNGADAVVHINTGIGIEETREFVRETCAKFEWPLLEYKTEEDYESIVKKHGFPGPHGHRYMYTLLKERPLRQLIRDYKQDSHDHIGLITGVRRSESRRRMGTTEPVQKDGARVWIAPFIDMEKRDLQQYMRKHDLPTNPVVEHLHMSGECLCGAYAHKGELAEIRLWYPRTARKIEAIQDRVTQEHPWEWEAPGPPNWYAEMQRGQQFFGAEFSPLCVGCESRMQHKSGAEHG